MDEPLRTRLYGRHAALGAHFGAVGRWTMPMWYAAGAVREHQAAFDAALLFDTSHMTTLLVDGAGARAFLNAAFTRDIGGLPPGRAAYGAFLDDAGHAVDDAIIMPLSATRFAVVANASMGAALLAHWATQPDAPPDATATDLSTRVLKMDLQGARAPRILRRLLDRPELVAERFPFFSFIGNFDFAADRADADAPPVTVAGGVPAVVSRTGYTGEVGVELFVPAERGAEIWDRLMELGAPDGLLPGGYAARDSLRAGAMLALSHQDIGPWPFIHHPWPWALPFSADGAGFTKKFRGADALLAARATAPHTLAYAGFDPRKIDTATARVLTEDGEDVGVVTTAVAELMVGRVDGAIAGAAGPHPDGWTPRGLACGFVRVARPLPAGTRVTLRDARRTLPADIVSDLRPGRTARRPWASFV